jgi:hypothetical protein
MLLKGVGGKAKHCRSTAHFRNTSHEKEQNGLRVKVKMLKRRKGRWQEVREHIMHLNTDGDRQIFDSRTAARVIAIFLPSLSWSGHTSFSC